MKWIQRSLSRGLDYRAIAARQLLYTTSPLAPGSVFFLPHGVRILNRLQEYLRSRYRRHGYDEVSSPQLYKRALWEQSGHAQCYAQDMFYVAGEEEQLALKPMNCPGHCLMYAASEHSYRDLPLRYADFSPLHRNEASGALSGLTRLRRFHQDDGHIFCTRDQVESEISAALALLDEVYTALRVPSYRLLLSTRPANFMGRVEEWERAEEQLRRSLDASSIPWTVNEADGAFYGPKIDVILTDGEGRQHQTATIQLDFQLPLRFHLTYRTSNGGEDVPVMIHRALLGSLERFLAILMETTGGKWPFWLSPRQAVIATVNDAPETLAFATHVQRIVSGISDESIGQRTFFVDLDGSARTVGKKAAAARDLGYNYVITIGDREVKDSLLHVQQRGGQQADRVAALDLYHTFVAHEQRLS